MSPLIPCKGPFLSASVMLRYEGPRAVTCLWQGVEKAEDFGAPPRWAASAFDHRRWPRVLPEICTS